MPESVALQGFRAIRQFRCDHHLDALHVGCSEQLVGLLADLLGEEPGLRSPRAGARLHDERPALELGRPRLRGEPLPHHVRPRTGQLPDPDPAREHALAEQPPDDVADGARLGAARVLGVSPSLAGRTHRSDRGVRPLYNSATVSRPGELPPRTPRAFTSPPRTSHTATATSGTSDS